MLAKTLYLPNGYSIALEGMPAAISFGMYRSPRQSEPALPPEVWFGGGALLVGYWVSGWAPTQETAEAYYYSPEDAAINGSGPVMGQTYAEDLRQKLRIKPTVCHPGQAIPFNVTVTQDIVFPGSVWAGTADSAGGTMTKQAEWYVFRSSGNIRTFCCGLVPEEHLGFSVTGMVLRETHPFLLGAGRGNTVPSPRLKSAWTIS